MNGRPRVRGDLSDLAGYHSPQAEVPVRLNTNESPYPPPPEFVEAWTAALAEVSLHRYPDRSASALREALAASLGQPVERVFCANGSNEVLQSLLLAYGGASRFAAVFEPTYTLHAHITRVTGTGVITGERGPGFRLDPDDARRVLARCRPEITFLCTPNNPTGVVEERDTVEAVIDAATSQGPGLVIIDEAYGEFAPWSALDLVDDDRPIAVVRTFSKVWSLAAVRLGFCVAPPWVLAELEKVVMPYHLPASTQLAGCLALGWRDEMQARVDAIVRERGRVAAALAGLEGVEVFPSGANFILFRPTGDGFGGGAGDGHSVWQALLERGVLVRDFSRTARLEGCLRVTIGTPGENDVFLAALEEVMS